MARILDLIYLVVAIVTSPVWLTRMIVTGKIRTDWRGRFGRGDTLPTPGIDRPRILVHAVSVGEVNAIVHLVRELRPEFDVVIAAGTNTGVARAEQVFGESATVVRFPFDFSFAVRRFLDRVQPHVVALAELEVWPTFTAECAQRGVPVVVVNGRISDRSFPRYELVRPLLAASFRRLSLAMVQDDVIADRFRRLGAIPDRIEVIGTMKWDTATIVDSIDGADQLADELKLDRARPIVVAGSTGPGEEALLDQAVPHDVQLIVAPRKPERFNEAAAALPGCARLTELRRLCSAIGDTDDRPRSRFLLDTIGDLRKAYSLADVVVVGRSFARLGGSDMIEPIALGKATVVGPHTQNFDAVTRALVSGGGLVQVEPGDLPTTIRRLLGDPGERASLAAAGRAVIFGRQGVTSRHVARLRNLIAAAPRPEPKTRKTGA